MSDRTPNTTGTLTFCGRCNHPMHWKVCGAGADMTAGACQCRNDQAMSEMRDVLAAALRAYTSQPSTNPDAGYGWGADAPDAIIAALATQGVTLTREPGLREALDKFGPMTFGPGCGPFDHPIGCQCPYPLAAAEHDRLLAIHEALTNIPSLRLTGEQLDALPDGTNREDFFVDVDEHDDWLPLSIVEAVVDRAALATQGVTLTREPGLDVDRLMEAMDEAFELDDVFVDDVAAWWRPFAAKVAHEYAALASEEPT